MIYIFDRFKHISPDKHPVKTDRLHYRLLKLQPQTAKLASGHTVSIADKLEPVELTITELQAYAQGATVGYPLGEDDTGVWPRIKYEYVGSVASVDETEIMVFDKEVKDWMIGYE